MIPDIAIILAAGVGRRLQPLTLDVPKCLLRVGGDPILARQLRELHNAGLKEVCVVTGHFSERVSLFLQEGPACETAHACFNRDFASSNNAVSLTIALERHPGRSFLLLDGDLLFDGEILQQLTGDGRPDLMVVERDRRKITEESMKVRIDAGSGEVLDLGKGLEISSGTPSTGEFIGMAKFSRVWSARILTAFRSLSDESCRDLYYEDLIRPLLESGPPIGTLSTEGRVWHEIDTATDLEEASQSALVRNSSV